MSLENDSIFTAEPQPEPTELDISTIHELRFRVAGIIMQEQIEIAHSKGISIEKPQSDTELIEAVAKIETHLQHELPVIKRERAAIRQTLWKVMDAIDDMENEALK